MKIGFNFTADFHNLSGYPTKKLELRLQLKRKEISLLRCKKPGLLGQDPLLIILATVNEV